MQLSERDLSAFATKEVEQGIHQRFADLQRKRNFRSNDLTAGREYVASYVIFVHYVEELHEAAEAAAGAEAIQAKARAGAPISNRGGHILFASTS